MLKFLKIKWILFLILASCGKNNDSDQSNNYLTPQSLTTNFGTTIGGKVGNPVTDFAITELKMLPPDPSETNLNSLKITQYAGYPLRFTFSVTSGGDPFETTFYFGLLEKPPTNPQPNQIRSLSSCNLGSYKISHQGSDDNGVPSVQTFEAEFIVPIDCFNNTNDLTMNLFAGYDQLNDLEMQSYGLTSGSIVLYSAEDTTQTVNQLCHAGNEAATKGCAYDILVKKSQGLSVIFKEMTPESSIGVIRSNMLENETSDVTSQANENDTPFLKVNSTVALYGADTALDNGLTNGKTVTMSYDICPASSATQTENSCIGGNWLPLDIMDTNNPNNSSSGIQSVTLTSLVPTQPTMITHSLYLNSTAFNAISQGVWRSYAYFNVRGCLATNFTESDPDQGTDALDGSNNCQTNIVRIMQLPSTSALGQGQGLSLTKLWEDLFGSKKYIGVNMGVNTTNSIDVSGESIYNIHGYISMVGWINTELFGVEYKSKASVNDESGSMINYIIFGYPLFYKFLPATQTSTKNDNITTSDMGSDGVMDIVKNLFKEQCMTVAEWPVFGIPVKLKPCMKGTHGFGINLGVLSKPIQAGASLNFPTATTLGAISGTFTPEVAYILSLSVMAGFSLLEAGVKGSLDVARLKVPAGPEINWGYTPAPKSIGFKLTLQTDIVLSTLNGSIALVIGIPAFGIFSGGISTSSLSNKKDRIPFNIKLFGWKGASYTLNLLRRTYPLTTLQ